jgi:hypothetical protein
VSSEKTYSGIPSPFTRAEPYVPTSATFTVASPVTGTPTVAVVSADAVSVAAGASVAAAVSVATGGSVAAGDSVTGGSVMAVVGSNVAGASVAVAAGAQAASRRANAHIAPSKVLDFILTPFNE